MQCCCVQKFIGVVGPLKRKKKYSKKPMIFVQVWRPERDPTRSPFRAKESASPLIFHYPTKKSNRSLNCPCRRCHLVRKANPYPTRFPRPSTEQSLLMYSALIFAPLFPCKKTLLQGGNEVDFWPRGRARRGRFLLGVRKNAVIGRPKSSQVQGLLLQTTPNRLNPIFPQKILAQ